MFTPEMKKAASAVVTDAETKMSTRVLTFLYYLTIRACEIIDWWFPVKVQKKEK